MAETVSYATMHQTKELFFKCSHISVNLIVSTFPYNKNIIIIIE